MPPTYYSCGENSLFVSFCTFLNNLKSIKQIQLCGRDLGSGSSLETVLESLSGLETLQSLEIVVKFSDSIFHIDSNFSFLSTCLASNKSLMIFKLDSVEEMSTEFQDLDQRLLLIVDTVLREHPSLVKVQVRKKELYNDKNIAAMKNWLCVQLENRYKERNKLDESQLVLMGDGRTGKTCLLRNLCSKRFMSDIPSTVVLEDTNVLQIKNKKIKHMTKYQLSVERSTSMIALSTVGSSEFEKNHEFRLSFLPELAERTVRSELFVEAFRNNDSGIISRAKSYFRAYDFGGQEIFSAIHHLFLTSDPLCLVVFNMTKFRQKDIQRLTFWCESILKNAPKSYVIFVGTFFKLFKKRKGLLEEVNLKLKHLLLKLSGRFCFYRSEKYSFCPIDNSDGKNSLELKYLQSAIAKFNYEKSMSTESIGKRASIPILWIIVEKRPII
eukprot:snap_masked-scaffold_2-processed-gene-13.24-mRNA-1 protein AED:1.00 eAED:1.00 QI:0/0/0/0/1/1/5/0/439